MTHTTATHAPLGTTAAPGPEATPRIYVACLAAYNHGRLHGAWIEATTPEAVMAEVSAMLAASPEPDAEEWAIHDHEGFEGAHLSEYASFQTVCDLAAFFTEHGSLGARLYSEFGDALEQARAAFEELTRDSGTEIPTALAYYIDWQALARDMAMNGEIMVFQTGFDEVHIFWSR